MTPETLDNMRWVAHHDPETVTPDWLVERLDALQAELDERYMAYPLDADGVPIHIGDVVDDHGVIHNVMAVSASMWTGFDGYGHNAKLTRHFKYRTVEDVLVDVARKAIDKRLNGLHALTDDDIRRYADEIRELLLGDEPFCEQVDRWLHGDAPSECRDCEDGKYRELMGVER